MDHQPGTAGKASDYLANERTFLAWIRTSISILTFGFVIAKFGVWLRELAVRLAPGAPTPEPTFSRAAGIAMMALGGILALLAAWHYYASCAAIEQGEFTPDRRLVGFVTVAVTALAIAMIVYMLRF